MIVMKCQSCGKKVVWDDFQPMDIKCPNCRADLNVRTSLKQNIRDREVHNSRKLYYCPHCKGLVPRRWFIRCAHCQHWLFGPASFSGKWPFILGVAIIYLLFTVYYVIYIH
jgi:phage FluMu protein Com